MPRRLATQQPQTPTIIVAGGAGFLGSHICESLLQSGVRVLALDDLVTGAMANLAGIKQHPNFEFIECNINQGIPPAIQEKHINYIIHAAGVETHGESQDATLAMALTGAFGTKNLLDLAVACGAHFLLISSINVYEGLASSTSLSYYFGSRPEQEARFSQHEAKRYAEGLCELYAREYNLDARVARLSQLYGPRMDLRSPELIARLIRSTLSGEDLKVDADSSTTMLLTYVSDAVYGISRLLFAEGAAFKGSIYSFANPEKVSVISVAYTLRDFLPTGKEVKFLPTEQVSDFALPKIPGERVKRDLDWEPAISITEGLKKTIESFRKEAPPTENHIVRAQHLQTTSPSLKVEQSETIEEAKEPSLRVPPTETATQPETRLQGVPGLRFRGGGESGTTDGPEVPSASPSAQSTKASAAVKDRGQTKKGRRKVVKVPSWWRRLLFTSLALIAYGALMRPAVHTLAYGVAGGLNLRSGINQAKSLQLDRAENSFLAAEQNMARGEAAVDQLEWAAKLSGQSTTFFQLQQVFVGSAHTATALATLTRAAGPVLVQAQHLARFDKPVKGDTSFTQVISDTRTTLGQVKQQIKQARLAFNQPESSRVAGAAWASGHDLAQSGIVGGVVEQANNLLSQLSSGVDQLDRVMAVLPTALGNTTKKQYLIMLQNSNELRPTGGFLGSYALITLDRGRVAKFTIDDIYNPAGQLHATEPAPPALQKAFGVKVLSLIDANWSPDTTVAGQEVAKLYTEATGEPIDGVVFVTTQAMRQVLAAVGPTSMDGYKETVTSDNFTQLAQVYSDVGFTPGSTGKRDFLAELSNQLINKLHQGGASLWLPVGKALATSLAQKEVTAWSQDGQVLAILDQQDWSGRTTSKNQGDYLRVVDANLGANKANFYVQRSTEYAINVDRDSALHGVVKVTWKHQGTSATWPGGDYLNYVRIYVPPESVLNESDGFDSDQVTVSQEAGKTVFGGFVKVPYDSQKTIELRYSLPLTLSLPKREGAYKLTWQKQSGIEAEPLKIIFNTPIFLKPTDITHNGTLQSNGGVVWQDAMHNDSSIQLTLQDR